MHDTVGRSGDGSGRGGSPPAEALSAIAFDK